MTSSNTLANEIDAVLPQTQCTLCGYQGCMPYAQALAQNQAEINLCPPGGVTGLRALAQILNKDPTPFVAEMEKKSKPQFVAVIREAECIGCTKCIPVCPVDAIVGSGKLMHTVIRDVCTGCELCIAPCPVDCIDLVLREGGSEEGEKERMKVSRERYGAHLRRREKGKESKAARESLDLVAERKAYVQAAVMRVRHKKSV